MVSSWLRIANKCFDGLCVSKWHEEKKIKLGTTTLRKVLRLRQQNVVGFDKGQVTFLKRKHSF